MRSRSNARKWLVFVGCLIVSIVGYELYRTRYVPPTERVLRIYGGEEHFDTIVHADQISVYRIDPNPGGNNPRGLDYEVFGKIVPADFQIISGPVTVTENQHQTLARVFARESTYPPEHEALACGPPFYGVRIDFKRGDDLLQLLLCFHCSHLRTYLNGELKSRTWFPGGRTELLQLVKQHFPNDQDLQKISN